ncbi:hypothetical protein SHXM_07739 [Streptomyces hygroscopicus]|nr:hypothetical protein SHXM_07739 [Streptomyces hygroscopicus]
MVWYSLSSPPSTWRRLTAAAGGRCTPRGLYVSIVRRTRWTGVGAGNYVTRDDLLVSICQSSAGRKPFSGSMPVVVIRLSYLLACQTFRWLALFARSSEELSARLARRDAHRAVHRDGPVVRVRGVFHVDGAGPGVLEHEPVGRLRTSHRWSPGPGFRRVWGRTRRCGTWSVRRASWGSVVGKDVSSETTVTLSRGFLGSRHHVLPRGEVPPGEPRRPRPRRLPGRVQLDGE